MSVTIPSNQTSSGTIYVSSGSGGGGSGFAFDPKWSTGTTNIQSSLTVKGSADIDGDLTVKGRSITQTLEKIEERLAILPPPNLELERNWSELADLRQQYVELERKLLEKQRVFDILKKS
jgi:hypothetical protein